MSKIITNDSGQQYRKQNFWTNAAGAAAGGATYFAAKNILNPILNRSTLSDMVEYGRGVDNKTAQTALNEVLKIPSVAAKKIEIFDFDKLPKIEFPYLDNYLFGKRNTIVHEASIYSKDIIDKEKHINSVCKCLVPMWKKPFKALRERHRDLARYTFQEGRNALCDTVNNRIYVNLKNFCAGAFHEIGHLMNPKLGTMTGMLRYYAPPEL